MAMLYFTADSLIIDLCPSCICHSVHSLFVDWCSFLLVWICAVFQLIIVKLYVGRWLVVYCLHKQVVVNWIKGWGSGSLVCTQASAMLIHHCQAAYVAMSVWEMLVCFKDSVVICDFFLIEVHFNIVFVFSTLITGLNTLPFVYLIYYKNTCQFTNDICHRKVNKRY